MLYGNCVMIDVQFWLRPDVQRCGAPGYEAAVHDGT